MDGENELNSVTENRMDECSDLRHHNFNITLDRQNDVELLSEEEEFEVIENRLRERITEYRTSDGCEHVTVVWMRSKRTQKSLFQLIAGSLNEPVDGCIDRYKVISTHSLFNDLLHEFITERCEEYLRPLPAAKKKALLSHNPRFIVTKSPPVYGRVIYEDESEEDDDDEEWSYSCNPGDIVLPVVRSHDRSYSYENGDVMFVIDEPQIPSPHFKGIRES